MATNLKVNKRGGRIFREKYVGETSPTITDLPAETVERLYIQESLHSFPGLVPSGPHDGLVRKPLIQEDTYNRSEYTTSHQNQSRILGLNRIWEGTKIFLADTAISIKNKQSIVLGMALTGTKLVQLNGGRVGDVATGLDNTFVLTPLNVDDVKHHFGEIKGFRSSYNQRF